MVPKVPTGAGAQAEQGSWASYTSQPLPACSPHGLGSFSSQEGPVWGRTLEDGMYTTASHHVLLGQSWGAAKAVTRGGTSTAQDVMWDTGASSLPDCLPESAQKGQSSSAGGM